MNALGRDANDAYHAVGETALRILLVDLDDSRRRSRVQMLESVGYEVETRTNYVTAEQLDHEGTFDLVIVTLHCHPEETAAYSNQLSRTDPALPILLLTDSGVFVPRGTLSQSLEAGSVALLMQKVSSMLVGSEHIREI
jgi:DNA-binding NtrC family response regulator